MNKEQAIKRMNEIENIRFSLAMVDRWTTKQREEDAKLFQEWLYLGHAYGILPKVKAEDIKEEEEEKKSEEISKEELIRRVSTSINSLQDRLNRAIEHNATEGAINTFKGMLERAQTRLITLQNTL